MDFLNSSRLINVVKSDINCFLGTDIEQWDFVESLILFSYVNKWRPLTSNRRFEVRYFSIGSLCLGSRRNRFLQSYICALNLVLGESLW